MAQASAVAIDALKLNEIIGTVAGDDTVFIMCRNEQNAIDLVSKFDSILKDRNR